MKKIIFVIAKEGFQDYEFKIPFLELSEFERIIASTEKGKCKGALGSVVNADISFSEVEDFDALVLIGGPGSPNLVGNPILNKIIKKAFIEKKIIGGICYSPIILANAGILKGRSATVWNNNKMQEKIFKKKGVSFIDKPLVIDGLIITANGPPAAKDYGKTLQIMLKNPYKRGAEEIGSLLRRTIKKEGHANFAVVGGRSAAKLFDELSIVLVPWQNVDLFFVDERKVPLSSEESNFFIFKKYFKPKFMPNVFPLENISDYNKKINEFGNFDVVFLSSGDDSHVGACFPNHPLISSKENYIEINDSPKPPKNRMTASLSLLSRTKHNVIFFINKKEAFKNFNDENISLEDCPAKVVKFNDYYIVEE